MSSDAFRVDSTVFCPIGSGRSWQAQRCALHGPTTTSQLSSRRYAPSSDSTTANREKRTARDRMGRIRSLFALVIAHSADRSHSYALFAAVRCCCGVG